MEERNITSLRKQYSYYKTLGERTFYQVKDEHLFMELAYGCNSIGTIVKHLSGNMKSRFTDFLTSDGEKEWRNRDAEFLADIASREEMMKYWEDGWKVVFSALDQVDDLNQVVYIRNQEHTVSEALLRQLAHYAYHIGQVVFIGKCLLGEKWKSLSIPLNSSQVYNDEKFAKGKNKAHYTDEFIDES